MLKFHSTSLQDSWRYGCCKIYSLSFFFLHYASIVEPDNVFPPLPSFTTSCARHSVVPRHCSNVVIAGFFQMNFMMASVRRTICVAWCCPGGTTFQTYFICESNLTKSSIMTSIFFNIAVGVHCCPLGKNFKRPTTPLVCHEVLVLLSASWILVPTSRQLSHPQQRRLGKHMALDKTFYSLLFKQEVVGTTFTFTFSSLLHASKRPLLKI